MGEKSNLVSRLVASTDVEIVERIFESVTSYTTEKNEGTFKFDTVFYSFHHQAKTPISDRALLARFLMLWLEWCVMPTLPHKVIIADVIYLVVLLAHGQSLGLFPAIIGCLQSGLRALYQSFCSVVIEEDKEGNIIVNPDGESKVKTLNPHVELPYTYFMAWYIMHCPSLMSAVQSSEDFMPFVQRLERSSWNGWYMLMIRQILQSSMKYQFVRCFPDFPGGSYGEQFSDHPGADEFTSWGFLVAD